MNQKSHQLPPAYRELLEYRRRFNMLDWINPTNVDACKTTFFESRESPQFKYLEQSPELQQTIQQVEKLNLEAHPAQELYQLIQRKLLQDLEIMKSVGKPSFARLMLEQSSNPSPIECQQATEMLDSRRETVITDKIAISPDEVLEVLQDELQNFGLNDWGVIFGNTVARCRVVNERQSIELNRNAKYYQGDTQKLVVHEIYGHVLRHANGASQPLPILAFGMPNYLETEEGIIGWLEQQWGYKSDHRGAARHVIATEAALRTGFTDTFETIRPYCASDDLAFRLTVRAKRGVHESSLPGAYLNDLAYFRGIQVIRDFLGNGGQIESLYVGKIGVQHLELIKPLLSSGWVRPATWLPPRLR